MSVADLVMWVTLLGALLTGGWRVLRALVSIVKAMEGIGELSGTFSQWTEDMRKWQGETETRLTRLETLQMVGEHR